MLYSFLLTPATLSKRQYLYSSNFKMKVFAIVTLATLAVAAPASLSSRQACKAPQDPNEGAIRQWLDDVENVNKFLNAAVTDTPQQVFDAAPVALSIARDEPVELGILAEIPCLNVAGSAYGNAVAVLSNIFEVVINELVDLSQSFAGNSPAGQRTLVNETVHSINQDRCCFVLPNLQTIINGAAPAIGIPIATVPLPNACAEIVCDGSL
jgi:hypothetical protein